MSPTSYHTAPPRIVTIAMRHAFPNRMMKCGFGSNNATIAAKMAS